MNAPRKKSSSSKKVDPPPDPPSEQLPAPTKSPLEAAVDFVTQGASAFEARAAIALHFPGEDPDRILEEAAEWVARTAYSPVEFVMGRSLIQLDDLHQQLRSTGDFAGAVGAVKARVQLAKWLHANLTKQPRRMGSKAASAADGPIELFEL